MWPGVNNSEVSLVSGDTALDGIKSRYLVHPRDLNAVTDTQYPFDDKENKNGIQLESEVVIRFWNLFTRSGDDVRSWYTGEAVGPHQRFARTVAVACEREIELHAAYESVMDRIEYVDKQRRAGELLPNVQRSALVAQCIIIYDKWMLSTVRVKRLKLDYYKCQEDRIKRLNEAIDLVPIIQNGVESEEHLESWVPDAAFINAMKQEVAELKAGIRMTRYYRMQSAWADVTGRPFYNRGELDLSGVIAMESDPYSCHPIKGTMQERFRVQNIVY
jgi:hypothetical protein